MLLDYNPSRSVFYLRLPRREGNPQEIMTRYGFDYSVPASTAAEAVLFTHEPYAAAAFHKYATGAARVQLEPLIREVDASWAENSGHFDVPDGQLLAPFQGGSVRYALRRRHVLIGDEPGLGKTPQAITVANEMRARRVLVVCPASIRFQWLRRIAEWSTMPRYLERLPRSYAITSSGAGVHDEAEWTVCSWNLVSSPGIWRALAKGTYDLLVLDEAHYAKTVDAKRTRAVFGGGRDPVAEPLAERAGAVLALTGTPLPNRPREAYVLARHLCWESIDWLSEDAFRERFNPSKLGRTKDDRVYVDERVGRTPELQARLRANFMARHIKTDDIRRQMGMTNRPVFDLIQVEQTQAVKQALAAESLLEIDPENLEGADAAVLGQIATARRMMGIAMAPQVAAYIEMLIDGGEDKLVVFAWHTQVLDLLCSRLQRFGIVRVDGSDSARSKDAKVQKFIADPATRIIVGNVLSLGTGTDGLQKVCDHALIAEPDWVHGNNQQCIDRLDRGGQRGSVQADIFVAPGSLAERVLAAALRKAQIIHSALDRQVA